MTASATATPSKEQSVTHQLASGAVLYLQRVPYKRADALRKALFKAFGASPLTPSEMKITLDGLKENPSAGGALLQRFLMVLSSDEVDNAMMACLQGIALYQPKGSGDRLPVDESLFDHPDYFQSVRSDQVQIWMRVAEVAVKPFLESLLSVYTGFQRKAGNTPATKPTLSPAAS